jgi:hypothetical protein
MNSRSAMTSTSSEYSFWVRTSLRERCATVLKRIIPRTEGGVRSIWNQESIRTLTAVFELRRGQLHSELDDCGDTNNECDTVARVIHELATRTYFTDLRSPNLLVDLEAHLRLLASAIRVYKYSGRCLDLQIHQDVYRGLENLANTLENNRRGTDERLKIEEWNAAFLLKHCLYLLLSVDNSGAVGRTVARRAVMAFDHSVEEAEEYSDLKSVGIQILRRQRSRPKWHDEYMHLEDTCWSIFVSDIHGCCTDIDVLLDETNAVTHLLRDSMRAHPIQSSQTQNKAQKLRHVVQTARNLGNVAQNDVYDEDDYLRYGILDLFYQLSFRTRKRSRVKCFTEHVKLLRMVLEGCSSTSMRTKATDLWNRILDLGEIDHIGYGTEEDRQAIHNWISRHPDDTEPKEYSAVYLMLNAKLTCVRRCKRIQRQVKEVKREQASIIYLSRGTLQSSVYLT